MKREPQLVPKRPGVFMLVNHRRRVVYFAATADLQSRCYHFVNMLENGGRWNIAQLPKHPAEEWGFVVLSPGPLAGQPADAMVKRLKRDHKLVAEGYAVVGGNRSAAPLVELYGRRMTLTEALAGVPARHRPDYNTAYRRLARGWSVEQALGLHEPPLRGSRSSGQKTGLAARAMEDRS